MPLGRRRCGGWAIATGLLAVLSVLLVAWLRHLRTALDFTRGSIERDLALYAATTALIEKRNGADSQELFTANTAAFKALIASGYFVEFSVGWDRALRFQERLDRRGIPTFRSGSSIIGGQWAPGHCVVRADDARVCARIVASLDQPDIEPPPATVR